MFALAQECPIAQRECLIRYDIRREPVSSITSININSTALLRLLSKYIERLLSSTLSKYKLVPCPVMNSAPYLHHQALLYFLYSSNAPHSP